MSHTRKLLKVLKAIVKDAELVARNSYSVHGEKSFEASFKLGDPEGYKLWKRAKKAIAAAEDKQ